MECEYMCFSVCCPYPQPPFSNDFGIRSMSLTSPTELGSNGPFRGKVLCEWLLYLAVNTTFRGSLSSPIFSFVNSFQTSHFEGKVLLVLLERLSVQTSVKGYYRIKIVYILCIYKQERCVLDLQYILLLICYRSSLHSVKPTSSSDRQALQNSIQSANSRAKSFVKGYLMANTAFRGPCRRHFCLSPSS